MQMQHVYQPLLIRALIDSGGIATMRQLALELLASDESQILYYEDRVRKMPIPVLKRRGIVEVDGPLVRLRVEKLTFEEKARLRALCEQKIGDFLESHGLDAWGNRMLELDQLPESIRYDVLKRDRTCRLCGAGRGDDVRLEVDHIVPRSKGGSNDLSNLQVLCDRCNRGKSNRDDTKFA
jgi:hypothetical protein